MAMMSLRKKTKRMKKAREVGTMEITPIIPVIVLYAPVVLQVVPVNVEAVAVLPVAVYAGVVVPQIVKACVAVTVMPIVKPIVLFPVRQFLNIKSIDDEKNIFMYAHNRIMG